MWCNDFGIYLSLSLSFYVCVFVKKIKIVYDLSFKTNLFKTKAHNNNKKLCKRSKKNKLNCWTNKQTNKQQHTKKESTHLLCQQKHKYFCIMLSRQIIQMYFFFTLIYITASTYFALLMLYLFYYSNLIISNISYIKIKKLTLSSALNVFFFLLIVLCKPWDQ